MQREIIRIDADKCDGCGRCISGCPEGALQLIDGKARLVREDYCDGLGACLGVCPTGAISFETREAAAFDAAAAARHMAMAVPESASSAAGESSESGRLGETRESGESGRSDGRLPDSGTQPAAGCPGLKVMQWAAESEPAGLRGDDSSRSAGLCDAAERSPSELKHWPVQLSLVPPGAPFLRGADLLLTADCAPVALGDFHRRLLAGRAVVLGCPKLDDRQRHVEKLAAIISQSVPRRITVVHMDVPCCLGLVQMVQQAMSLAGQRVSVDQVTVGRNGQVLRAVSWDV